MQKGLLLHSWGPVSGGSAHPNPSLKAPLNFKFDIRGWCYQEVKEDHRKNGNR